MAGLARQRLDAEHLGIEGLAEIVAAHARTQHPRIERRPVADRGMQRVPIAKAVLRGNQLQSAGMGDGLAVIGKARA